MSALADDQDEEAMLDRALAASLAWQDAEEARRRRRSNTRDRLSPDFMSTCQWCGHPFMQQLGNCDACGMSTSPQPDLSRQASSTSRRQCFSVDPHLNLAIAQSLQEEAPQSSNPTIPQPDERSDTSLDAALAGSLHELWECLKCSNLNIPASIRCSVCDAYIRSSVAEAASLERALDSVTAAVPCPSADPSIRCGIPGCGAWGSPRHFGFCSQCHRDRAEGEGLLSPSHPHVERAFAAPDGTWSAHVLTRRHSARQPVVDQFLGAWRKRHVCPHRGSVLTPRVQRVLALRPPPEILTRFSDHLAAVGNARKLFHGTSMTCDFGVDPAVGPCAASECAVCNICRAGFSLDRAGTAADQQMALRFGRGLYFSATSGKSHDYGQPSRRTRRDGSGHSRDWYVMFLCHVAVGRTHTTTEARLSQGEVDSLRDSGVVDSLTGEVGPNLNFDEVVTYDEASAIPSFLIVYTTD